MDFPEQALPTCFPSQATEEWPLEVTLGGDGILLFPGRHCCHCLDSGEDERWPWSWWLSLGHWSRLGNCLSLKQRGVGEEPWLLSA
jgi:hypothetical protein